MNEITITLKNGIDWELLRGQKETLLKVMDKPMPSNMKEDLNGIVNLIDGIQDSAVDSGEATNEEVFGPECMTCGNYMKYVISDTDGTNLEEGFECPECDG